MVLGNDQLEDGELASEEAEQGLSRVYFNSVIQCNNSCNNKFMQFLLQLMTKKRLYIIQALMYRFLKALST